MKDTPWVYITVTFCVGLILVFGFFSTARLHLSSIELIVKSNESKKLYENSKEEEQRLILISESHRAENNPNKTELQDTIDKQLLNIRNNAQFLYTDSQEKRALSEDFKFQGRKRVVYLIFLAVLSVIFLSVVDQLKRVVLFKQPLSFKISKITNFFFSEKNQKEVFQLISADWQEEYFEALSNKEIWKSRWINVRYIYAFLAAMWMKSPVGDLIEFIRKIAK